MASNLPAGGESRRAEGAGKPDRDLETDLKSPIRLEIELPARPEVLRRGDIRGDTRDDRDLVESVAGRSCRNRFGTEWAMESARLLEPIILCELISKTLGGNVPLGRKDPERFSVTGGESLSTKWGPRQWNRSQEQ